MYLLSGSGRYALVDGPVYDGYMRVNRLVVGELPTLGMTGALSPGD